MMISNDFSFRRSLKIGILLNLHKIIYWQSFPIIPVMEFSSSKIKKIWLNRLIESEENVDAYFCFSSQNGFRAVAKIENCKKGRKQSFDIFTNLFNYHLHKRLLRLIFVVLCMFICKYFMYNSISQCRYIYTKQNNISSLFKFYFGYVVCVWGCIMWNSDR